MSAPFRSGGRLSLFPKALSTCAEDAAAYALCVSKMDSNKVRLCDKEFYVFKNCMKNAMTKMKR